ncbi:LOW QUALITY PROTEIN: LIM and calponin homology domains-containing protein 1-like [Haliotis rubra]|uniref:LOW QUALITY PROTEIN: LIM and calponin homology domains-containing protein 1-like n=1 Tax=Haliotis rubra TaxID=36100 RepID=UPI001EE5D53E|nr:LOW QUALITY PROTEIN: LIM and calponin homology domains-containing protein 1-like [Haliotis rubra]
MAEDTPDNDAWDAKFLEDEEMDFFTELALHETERWIQAVTRKTFVYPDDPRKSLENGILLCELLNCLRPGSVKRINKQATPIAGLDNLNVFLTSLKNHFGLQDTHLFDVADLEDLSQRAIADSDQLKQVADRRLRNVAITVYWLGKVVNQSFQGPHLDFTAFAPLVHHHSKDIILDDHFRRDSSCSWESNELQYYGSHEGNSRGNRQEQENRHHRDSSYESYEKGSEDSLDEQVFDNMPVRYGSQSALNKTGEGMYSDDRQNSMYRSSPDLSQGSYHRRSSSNDSLDGSYHGSHSRQSSGSTENYPTRPHRRTSSSTADPLQFVKQKPTDLAKKAEEQMKVAATQKEYKIPVVVDKEEDDWQSNLSSWKTRRKSQSHQAYQMKEDLEELTKDKEGEVKTTLQTKTFSQIQQERERRKSSNVRSFYPVEENEDESDVSTRQDSAFTTSDSATIGLQYSSTVPDWAKDNEDASEDNNNNQSVDNKNGMLEDPFDVPETSPISKPSPSNRQSMESQFLPDNRDWEVRESVSKQNSRNNLESTPRSNKINDIRHRFEQSEQQPKSRSSTVDTKWMRSVGNVGGDSRFGQSNWSPKTDLWTYIDHHYKNVYGSLRKSGRDYTEKNIKISQKPNSEKGFGFTICGGVDTQQPVTVQKITLGSAADVCEVMARDEILAINKCDISSRTNEEVSKLIQDAVKSGQLELRVKRFLGINDDEDECLSSDDEFESMERSASRAVHREDPSLEGHTSYDSRDSTTSQEDFRAAVNSNPVASALDEERQWIMDQLDYGQPSQQEEVQDPADRHHVYKESESFEPIHQESPSPSQLAAEPYTSHRTDKEVLTRPTITMRRERGVQGSGNTATDTKPAAAAAADTGYEVERRSQAGPDGSGTDDVGPPAILRKWQRQRPQSEYTFEREKSPDKRLSSTLPWMDSKLAADDTRPKDDLVLERTARDFASSQPEPPVPSPRRRFEDQRKQEEWSQMQEDLRQQPDSKQREVEVPKEMFTASQTLLRQEYESDIRRAQEIAQQREEQEQQMLEPEMRRMRVTEERRQERRLRQQHLQQSAAETGPEYEARHAGDTMQLYEQNSNTPDSVPAEKTRSTMSFQIQSQGQSQGQGHPGVLVIDPRNRGDEESQPTYSFQVNMNQPGLSGDMYVHPTQQAALYEPPLVDVDAIREEERRKIREEERMREEEEDRRFREKEALLREQEEQLRQKEEYLRQEQERFHHEQEQLQLMRASAEQHAADVIRFEAPVSQVREASPSYQSTITQKRPEKMRNQTAPQYSTTVVVEPKPWQQGHVKMATDVSGKSTFSREDMLAMNRKPTPLQTRPNTTPPNSPTGSGPIKRPTPSREQLRSLNAVPKPKFRSSHDWIGSEQNMQHNTRSFPSSRHSDIMRKQYSTPQEHWLFEEAERRRLANQDPKSQTRQPPQTQFSGPIKPTTDNRWRGEPSMERRQSPILNTSFEPHPSEGSMPAAIRQTLLQKTAGARGSTGSNYSQDLGGSYNQYPNQGPSLSHTMPTSYGYNSPRYRDQQGQEMQIPPSSRAPPPPQKSDSSTALSGRQQCSHCNQELGFGAAMIIESLGLSYHVQCFKCCVCHTPLGNGSEGADVRVRVNKLHCPNCYSNDEAGLKFSKV